MMKRVMILLFGGALLSGIAAYAAMAKTEPRKPIEKVPAVPGTPN
jgi:Spy/CpxP family protein refolding chaperone